MHKVHATSGTVASRGLFARTVGDDRHPYRGICFGVVCLVMLAGVSGCVSSVGAVLEQPQPAVEMAGLAADGPEQTGQATHDGLNAEQAIAADEIPAFDVVPEPAPRDAAPLLEKGEMLAFAVEGEDSGPGNTPKLAYASPPSVIEGTPAQANVAGVPLAEKPARKKTLLELLFGRHSSRQATPTAEQEAPPQGAFAGTPDKVEILDTIDEEHDADGHGADGQPVQLASVGAFGRLSPNGLRTQTNRVDVACLKPQLIAILNRVERHFGSKPIVTSGYRNPNRNRRAGGARKSLHMQCMAADIQVEGVSKWDLAAYLRTVPGRGGVGTYCRTRSVHIDIGEERSWHYPCRRTSKRKS